MKTTVLVAAVAAFAFSVQTYAHEGHAHHCKKGFVLSETGACVKAPK